MLVELIGCTSAGKTTLAKKMVAAGKEIGADVQLSDDFMLQWMRLAWLKNEFLQRRAIELGALFACLFMGRKYRDFYRVVIRTCMAAPGSWLYRLKLLRVSLKKIGIYEIIRRNSAERQMVLLDNEGVLQASHTLYVHPSGARFDGTLDEFLELAPLSDVIAYVRLSETQLVERTLKRGHNRIPGGAGETDIAAFVEQAVRVFDEIRRCPRVADRLLVIDAERRSLSTGQCYANPSVTEIAGIIQASLA